MSTAGNPASAERPEDVIRPGSSDSHPSWASRMVPPSEGSRRGTQLSGGWTQRTREVIELPQVPAQVTEHVYLARTCPRCRRRGLPPAQLDGVALGRQRLGVNVVSLIAALREEARLPWRSIQWYLDTVHGLHLSLGAIVAATRKVAGKAQTELAGILEHIRGSPVVHA